MTDKKTILERVKKVLALANNNPSEGEAQTAMLMAQKLMAQYHISMRDLQTEDMGKRTVEQEDIQGGGKTDWQRALGKTIADNLRCEILLFSRGFRFIGMEEDLQIATLTFSYSVNIIQKGMKKIRKDYRKEGKDTTGIAKAYVMGFLKGLQDKFNEQVKQENFSLVLVKDNAVIEKAKAQATGRRKSTSIKYKNDTEAMGRGYQDGRYGGGPHQRIS